jgi:hypothetical protein
VRPDAIKRIESPALIAKKSQSRYERVDRAMVLVAATPFAPFITNESRAPVAYRGPSFEPE